MVTLKTVAINAVILTMLLNATPLVLAGSGVAEDFGVDAGIGGDSKIDFANQMLSEVEPSGGLGATLFQLFASMAVVIEVVMGVPFAAPTMLHSLGVPGWLTAFIFAPLYLITGATIIYVLTGRSL